MREEGTAASHYTVAVMMASVKISSYKRTWLEGAVQSIAEDMLAVTVLVADVSSYTVYDEIAVIMSNVS